MGKYTKQSDYIGKWSTKDKFQKDPGYTYMEIPRYFKVGTVSNVNKTIDSFVAKILSIHKTNIIQVLVFKRFLKGGSNSMGIPRYGREWST